MANGTGSLSILMKNKSLTITEIHDNGGFERDYIGTVNGEVIGRSELLINGREAEFRIHLLPEWQGKGYGTELAKETIKRGLKFLNRIWLGFAEGNEPARKLYEKLGFKYTIHNMEVRK